MILSPIAGINRVTQLFGKNPEVYKQFGMKGHNGIDLTGWDKNVMETVYSPFEGYVDEVGDQGKRGYGKFVRIRTNQPDDQGRIKQIVLAHLSKVEPLKKGQFIYMLDPVGTQGNTGFSSGPHVHFGLRYLDMHLNVLNADNGFLGYVDFFDNMRFWTFPPQKEAYPFIFK